jgi:DNA-binding IclR family transcriptional regulator
MVIREGSVIQCMLTGGKGRPLKTTRTSLRTLELIIKHEGLTLAELDRSIDKPKSTVHSHVHTLLNCRYLVEEDGVYNASFRLSLLGERARYRHLDDERTREAVEELAEATGEEANYTVLEHGRLLMAHGASGYSATEKRDTDFRTEYYLHNTAAGKAILANMERGRVERILESMPQEAETTITNRERLLDSLDEIADRGYGVFEGELPPGLVAVGVPIHYDRKIIGGLSVGGPKYRIDMNRLHTELADTLLETAEALENDL